MSENADKTPWPIILHNLKIFAEFLELSDVETVKIAGFSCDEEGALGRFFNSARCPHEIEADLALDYGTLWRFLDQGGALPQQDLNKMTRLTEQERNTAIYRVDWLGKAMRTLCCIFEDADETRAFIKDPKEFLCYATLLSALCSQNPADADYAYYYILAMEDPLSLPHMKAPDEMPGVTFHRQEQAKLSITPE